MSSLVVKYLPLIKRFKKLKPVEKRKIICNDEKFVQCVCELCLNLIKGNVPLNNPQKVKLRRHRNTIKKLSRHIKHLNNKKKLLQKGVVYSYLYFSQSLLI